MRTYQNNYSPKNSLLGAFVVMVTTKSGTREFQGTLFEYLRNGALDPRNSSVPMYPHCAFNNVNLSQPHNDLGSSSTVQITSTAQTV